MANLSHREGCVRGVRPRDIPAVIGALDPKISWREAEGNPYEPSGKAWIGHDEITQKLFMRIGAEWDYLRAIPHTFHDAGDTVVAEIRYQGQYKATGKTLDAQACHVFTLRGGKDHRVSAVHRYRAAAGRAGEAVATKGDLGSVRKTNELDRCQRAGTESLPRAMPAEGISGRCYQQR